MLRHVRNVGEDIASLETGKITAQLGESFKDVAQHQLPLLRVNTLSESCPAGFLCEAKIVRTDLAEVLGCACEEIFFRRGALPPCCFAQGFSTRGISVDVVTVLGNHHLYQVAKSTGRTELHHVNRSSELLFDVCSQLDSQKGVHAGV